MRFFTKILISISAFAFLACATDKAAQTPLDTLKTYTQAIRKKDAATMKNLLSQESIRMAKAEAEAQKTSLDEVVERETLFGENQSALEFRNEKTAGDRATIEVKDAYGAWEIIPFTKENGAWKIAKERYADELQKQADEDNKRLDEQINQGK